MADFAHSVATGLEKLRQAVETLKPIAKEFGGPTVDKVADLVSSGIAIAQNALERFSEAKVVVSSHDEAVIRKILADLQAENDELKRYIADS